MAYNFNNDPASPPGLEPRAAFSAAEPSTDSGASTTTSSTPDAAVAPVAPVPVSVGHTRFNSCRWQQPTDEGNAAFCTHREVKPYAGTTGFDPDAWCGECQYYKLRRAPKKRTPAEDYSY